MEQQIHFCTTADGVRIAYATVGEGRPLVKAANWLNHLEFDWRSPIWRHLLEELARDHFLIRYDERGNGLSDWNVENLSFEAFVQDLETVVEAVGLDRFPLLGISQGAAVAIAYVVRHPERVSHLILYGAYARGWAKRGSPNEIEQRQAQLTLVKLGWGQDNPAFRQLWTTLYAPDATPEQAQWFNDLQRVSTSPENAIKLLTELGNIDVMDLLPQVKVPTLVLHCRDEAGVPFEEGRRLAASIHGARFVQLEGRNHLLFETEPAWATFVAEVRRFLETQANAATQTPSTGNSAAQREMKMGQGTRLGRYEIRSKLGAGGMGEVYLAHDPKLERKVALKILPSDVAAHPDRMKRFVQEAKAASALNHPNILTIYEIDETDSGHFIATEFIDGQTLRERTLRAQFKLSESIDIAAQIASALAAAHAAGIVHRDIKPENVMLRHDGIVKVLDFGLAKLTATPSIDSIDSRAPTRAHLQTDPGVVMGTAVYMSPEQARGLPVDSRTDIFSLGVVLYEMVAGRLPFDGSNRNEIMASVVSDKEPQPLTRYSSEAPTELGRIVFKALKKNRDERYQTSKDLLLDLKSLEQELEFERKLEQSAPPKSESVTETVKPAEATAKTSALSWRRFPSRRALVAGAALLVLAFAVALTYLLISRRSVPTARAPEIRSLAVLPLKSLDAGENYLGLGIADAVIRRINQTSKLTVRPTSAVRRYLSEDTDALTAAQQLRADAVLEGSVQHADDRLRVSVNLLRVSDGASLWADSFDMRMTDIFTIQDTVAQQVASGLRLPIDASQQAQLTKRSTSNPIANEFYMKGVYALDQRMSFSKQQREATIDFFKRAIEADPNFALAHAQLAFAYASIAVFYEPTEPAWAERAKEEINRAQALDPQLAETHLARFQLLFSVYEGYQCEAAIRELLSAQQLNPNIGHGELGYLYIHLGLEDLAARELQRALDIDPTSEFAKRQTLNMYEQGAKYDEWLDAHQKFFPNEPIEALYFLGKGRLDQAQAAMEEVQKAIDEKRENFHFDEAELLQGRALLFALKGDYRAAEAEIPLILGKHPVKDPIYHHATYDIARVYALEGKSDEAVKWLRETAATGFQPYPMFERDAYLNRIRQAPKFVQFMTEMEARWEGYRREFGEGEKRQ